MPHIRQRPSDQADYIRGVMDRIRDYCDIPRAPDAKLSDGSWSYVMGNGIERCFKMEPYLTCGYRLMYLERKTWCQIACVKNENEAQIVIDNFLCGIDAVI
jgi:predicted nucleotide-binding protein (sugar kinase/HSP70/actin superfamily)